RWQSSHLGLCDRPGGPLCRQKRPELFCAGPAWKSAGSNSRRVGAGTAASWRNQRGLLRRSRGTGATGAALATLLALRLSAAREATGPKVMHSLNFQFPGRAPSETKRPLRAETGQSFARRSAPPRKTVKEHMNKLKRLFSPSALATTIATGLLFLSATKALAGWYQVSTNNDPNVVLQQC